MSKLQSGHCAFPREAQWPTLRLALSHAMAWGLAGQVATAAAAETLPKPDARTIPALPAVVVTAAFQASPLVVVLDPKAPVQPIPASDGADLLKTVPGFDVMRKGGSNGDPVFRGMAGSRLAIVMDGSLVTGGCPSRMDPPTAYISPALYDKVTIIKGPETVLYGPVGSAGTVLFERAMPDYRQPTASVVASTTAGSWGRNDQTVSFKGGTPLVYVDVDANRTQSGDYRDGRGARVHSSYRRWNANAAIGWMPDRDTLLELSAGTGNGQAAYAFSGMDGVQFLRQSQALRFEKRHLSEHWSKLEARIYHNHIDHVMDNYTLRHPDPHGMMPMAMASDLGADTNGGRLAASFDWADDLSLITGLDATSSTHDARNGGPEGSMMGYYKSLPRVRDARMNDIGGFVESRWQISPKDRLNAGVRLDLQSARGYGMALPAAGGMSMGSMAVSGMSSGMMSSQVATTVSRDRRARLPSGFVRYEHEPSRSQTLYVGFGHSERFPDYWELFGQHVGTTTASFGSLRPERTTQLDAGWQLQRGPWRAWVSAYAGRISDFILIHYGRSSGYADNVTASIAGGEAGAEYGFAPHWKASATLAYAWGEDETEHRPLPQMTPLESRLGLEWNDGRWSAGGLVRLVARQDRVAIGEGNIVGQDLGRTGGFTVFSLHGGWRISKTWNLTAGIDNLFNKTYAEHISPSVVEEQGFTMSTRVNEPGRIEWLKATMTL